MGRLVPTALATRMCPRKRPAARWRGSFAITCREFLRCSDIGDHGFRDIRGLRPGSGAPSPREGRWDEFQPPGDTQGIYPNTIKYFREITRNLVNSRQIQHCTKAQYLERLFGVIPREGADHVSLRSRCRDCRFHPHQRCNSLSYCVFAPHTRVA